MKVAYDTIVTQIINSIEGYAGRDFRHVARNDWMDDEGKLEQALVNNSFSIAIAEKFEIEGFESSRSGTLAFNIEFVLDAVHNNYLSILGDCEAAIVKLKTLKYAEFQLESDFQPDFEVSFEGDKVRVEFTKILYMIKRS